MAEFQYDVFLSHNAQDKPRVRRLAERLKAAGVRVWLDEWVIEAGDIIALKVDEGLEQSRMLLRCISPTALASGEVALEPSTAVHRDPANAGRRFIPLLLGDWDLPDTLRRYKVVDFGEECEAAFAEVLASCPRATPTSPCGQHFIHHLAPQGMAGARRRGSANGLLFAVASPVLGSLGEASVLRSQPTCEAVTRKRKHVFRGGSAFARQRVNRKSSLSVDVVAFLAPCFCIDERRIECLLPNKKTAKQSEATNEFTRDGV